MTKICPIPHDQKVIKVIINFYILVYITFFKYSFDSPKLYNLWDLDFYTNRTTDRWTNGHDYIDLAVDAD